MSWTPLQPPPSPSTVRLRGVIMGCSVYKAKKQQPYVAVYRESGVLWWSTGERVAVSIGSGDHAGWLRIVPASSGTFAIGKATHKNAPPPLLLPSWPGIAPGVHKSDAAEFDFTDEWLEVRIPGWGLAPPPAAQAAAPPPPTVNVKPPFSLAEGVMDPAAARRRGCGVVPSAPPPAHRR